MPMSHPLFSALLNCKLEVDYSLKYSTFCQYLSNIR